jgi:hypothetical protein
VLTALEQSFGGRKKCAATLAIEPTVLSNLGRLSAQFDPLIGRKAAGDQKALTGQELAWLKAAAVRLVRRVGEHAGSGPLVKITMADLPSV